MIRPVAVGSASGLHARAAALVAAAAAGQEVPITVRRYGRPPVPADSLLSLLTLAATHGTELVLEADGDDDRVAAALDRVAAALATDVDAPDVVRG